MLRPCGPCMHAGWTAAHAACMIIIIITITLIYQRPRGPGKGHVPGPPADAADRGALCTPYVRIVLCGYIGATYTCIHMYSSVNAEGALGGGWRDLAKVRTHGLTHTARGMCGLAFIVMPVSSR